MITTQLPLEFKLLDPTTFSNFFAGNNEQLLFALKNFIDPQISKENFFYLWGKHEVGKTHLLQACCHNALEQHRSAMYISLKHLLTSTSNYDVFNGLENVSLLCLDDLHLIKEQSLWEEHIFYLFNNLRTKQHKLLVASLNSPFNLKIKLADLQSRMTWGITYHLNELTEQEKIAALIMRSQQISLQLSEPVAKFLLSHVGRSTGQLFSILEQLDIASLAAKRRKLTIPFIKNHLKL